MIGGRVVALPSGHRRALLAAIAWAVWDEALPANEATPDGYRLAVPAEGCDVVRFQALPHGARAGTQHRHRRHPAS